MDKSFINMGPESRKKFKRALTAVLTYHGIDNILDTPDYILAEFLCSGLDGFERAIKRKIESEAKEAAND